ncbi:phosphatase PAP2 family protein [uncultured Maribacter sp.]|uniref:phosphatase PAP2 family protein n=1 Tax=uncultured Maribacter sp. TaxID=431308 RepID=UPI00261730A4|nr:phosphatase PAP2 family protein [uncultured Maribacter sp.]
MIKKILLGCFLLSFLFSESQHIKTDFEDSRWQMFTYDFGNIFKGVGYSYTRPLHWKSNQWATAGYTIAGTGLLYVVDKPVSDYFVGIKEDVPYGVRDYGFNVGSPSNNYLITGAVYLTGLSLKNEKLRRTGVLLIASATSAGFLQQVVKSAVGRARPLSGKSKDTFRPFWGGGKDYHSFPSGHAILAMTNAHAIAKQFKSPWIKTGIYAVGSIPAISRLWEGKHWLSDVALGVAISIFTVESIDKYLDSRYSQKYNEGSKKISWNLNFAPGQIGVVGRF